MIMLKDQDYPEDWDSDIETYILSFNFLLIELLMYALGLSLPIHLNKMKRFIYCIL